MRLEHQHVKKHPLSMVQRLLDRRLAELIRIVQAVPATVALRLGTADRQAQYLHFEHVLMQIGDASFAAADALRHFRAQEVAADRPSSPEASIHSLDDRRIRPSPESE